MNYMTHSDPEPPEGSVVLIHGDTGTAYQRLYRTGMWHPTSGAISLDWAELWQKSDQIILIHAAPKEN